MNENQRPAAGRDLLRARVAVSAAFFLMGVGPGIWAVHIPLIQERLQINPAIIGLTLLCMAVGALIAMPLAGWLVGRVGSRRPTAISMIVYLVVLPTPILAGAVPVLLSAGFFFGLMIGVFDVTANVQASEIETARQRPTMSSFHAFYSIGTLAGAVIGAGVIAIGWGDGSGALATAIVLLGGGVVAARNLFDSDHSAGAGPHFALPNRAVLLLGAIVFLGYAIEGAVTDWSALFLTVERGASPTTAALSFALFSLAMAGFRLFGDPLVLRFGSRTILVGGGLLCTFGLGIVLAAPSALAGAVGFGLVGAGAANVVPLLFSASARVPGVPAGVGVAGVATIGYTGFLISPPALGFIGDAYGLTASLGVVLSMTVLLVALGCLKR